MARKQTKDEKVMALPLNDDEVLERLQNAANLDDLKAILPPASSRRYYRLYALCAVVYLCSTMQGYDGSLMGSIYTQPDYLEYYNLDVNSSTQTGLVFCIYFVGQMTGGFFVWTMDWKGRVPCIWFGCLGAVIGAIITAATSTKSALIGGRWFLSFFATIACAAAPNYAVEVAPPHIRGKVAGFYNTLWYIGSILASFTTYGTQKNLEGNIKSFKIPLWVQIGFPSMVVLLAWMLPESPRWLVGVGRYDDARKFLVKYHGDGNPEDPIVDFEMAEIEESFRSIKLSSPKEALNILPLFTNKSDRYRFGLIVALSWFGQFSGNNVCSYYLPTMLTQVGMTSVTQNVLMNGVYSIVGWVSSIIGSNIHDRFGRRKMFLTSTLCMSLALMGLAVCTAEYRRTGADGASKGTLVFIYLFDAIFSTAFTPMQPIYPAEVASNLIRGKAQFIQSLVSGTAQFVNQFAAPKAMQNIRYWFYVFYVFFDIFEFFIVYFFFVETRGRTLEELDYIFEAPNPRKASTDKEFLANLRVKRDSSEESLKDNLSKPEVDHVNTATSV